MKKEQLSTSTQEEPKVKLALQEKYKEQDKKEEKKQETPDSDSEDYLFNEAKPQFTEEGKVPSGEEQEQAKENDEGVEAPKDIQDAIKKRTADVESADSADERAIAEI